MEDTTLTNRHKQILSLIKRGFCLPRELAHELKANKTNVSTALKYLLDNGYVVREKFYGTYVYALTPGMLADIIKQKSRVYDKQMRLEKNLFNCKRNFKNIS